MPNRAMANQGQGRRRRSSSVVTVALSKTAVRLVPIHIDLQHANGAEILTVHSGGFRGGVHQFLHAATSVLRRQQNELLRKAGMLSTVWGSMPVAAQ